MASATKIRPFARALDACDRPFWVIDHHGKLIYLSAATAQWLDVDPETLVGRKCIAGASISDDPLDFLAASLSAPPGFRQQGTARLKVQPPRTSSGKDSVDPMDVRFIRLGDAERVLTLAVAGKFDDADVWDVSASDAVSRREIRDAVELREMLDGWRQRSGTRAALVTAGVSAASRRLRARIQVACSVRTNIGFYGPDGCDCESIARHVHQSSCPGEPLVVIEGPLMDAELLDASASELLDHLTHSDHAVATMLVRGLDDMPIEAQERLLELLDGFGTRLRVLGLCSEMPIEFSDPTDDQPDDLQQGELVGLSSPLMDAMSSLAVRIPSLAERAGDIPMIATAVLDRRRSAGDSAAERLSRAALDKLVLYPWPGDFQELDQAMRHALRVATSPSIAVEHLPLAVRSYQVGNPTDVGEPIVSLDEMVSRYEQRLIESALDAADGNRAEAARRLKISRARLLRKLDQPHPQK